VVDGRAVPAIAAAVAELLAEPDRAAAMGAAGRRWVIERWRWERHGDRLAELLRG
jgi:phosphatidylinositol alpha-1,6-mannosyltransferase